MKTFVEDSDEGGDYLDSPIGSPAQPTAGIAPNAAPPSSHGRTSLNSSGSAKEVSVVQLTSPPPDDTFLMPSSKRRKTVHGPDDQSSPASRLKRSKTMKTYGKASQRKDGSSLDMSPPRISRSSQPSSLADAGARNRRHSLKDAGEWQLPASLQEHFAHHEPNAMFPEPSSTIPDNTMTQTRLIEDAIEGLKVAPITEITVTDLTTQKTSDSSIPWSEYLYTPSQVQQETLNPQAPGKSSSTSTPKRRGGDLDDDSPVSSRRKRRIGDSTPTSNNSLREQPTKPLNSDELAIGLPKEMYNPRPSRSRSAQMAHEQIKLPAKPGKSARKPRRSRTAGESTIRTVQPSSSEKLEIISKMGFSLSQSRKALVNTNNDLQTAIDWLCNAQASIKTVEHDVEDPKVYERVGSSTIQDQVCSVEQRAVSALGSPVGQVAAEVRPDKLIEPTVDPAATMVAPKAVSSNAQKARAVVDSDEEVDLVSAGHAKIAGPLAAAPIPPDAVEQPALYGPEEGGDPSDEKLANEDSDKEPITFEIPKPKRGRGRPRKDTTALLAEPKATLNAEQTEVPKNRGRGRPRKTQEPLQGEMNKKDDDEQGALVKGRGRKSQAIQDQVEEGQNTDHDYRRTDPVKGEGKTRRIQQQAPEDADDGDSDELAEPDRPETSNPNFGIEKRPKSTGRTTLADTDANAQGGTASIPAMNHDGPQSPPCTPPLRTEDAVKQTAKGKENAGAVQALAEITAAGSPHSPIKKGPVSYRVGLSRRARIAPLLRVVKK